MKMVWIFCPEMTLAQIPEFGFFVQNSRIGVKLAICIDRWFEIFFGMKLNSKKNDRQSRLGKLGINQTNDVMIKLKVLQLTAFHYSDIWTCIIGQIQFHTRNSTIFRQKTTTFFKHHIQAPSRFFYFEYHRNFKIP